MSDNSGESENEFIRFRDRNHQWDDIVPIDEFSNEVNILLIDYKDEIREINDYFRAILRKNEISKRAFNLTTELLKVSASNYMGWYHRRLCIDNMDLDLQTEMNFLDLIMEENQKNYQIWHHRKAILEKSNDPSKEKNILDLIFENEPKNFHAWCHRIWVVRRFNLIEGELEFTEKMLNNDSRNNSAWNYRYFLVNFVNEKITKEIIQSELKYALSKIEEIPNNESPYNYIRGLFDFKKDKKEIDLKFWDFISLKENLEEISLKNPKNYYCLGLLLDIEIQGGNKDNCQKIIDSLVENDFIRKKYWLWRKQKL